MDYLKNFPQKIYNNGFIKSLVSIFLSTYFMIFNEERAVLIMMMVSLVIVDLFLGISCAVKVRDFSIKKLLQSIWKSFLYFVLYYVSVLVSSISTYLSWIEPFVTFFVAANEFLSIMKNLSKLGVSLPLWMSEKILEDINKKTDNP